MNSALTVVQQFYPKVQKVTDARQPVEIEVQRSDASPRGRRRHGHCAMAEACKRSMNLDGAVIARKIAYLIKGRVATRYEVPQRLMQEIITYDRGGAFAPGEYKLYKPAPTHRLSAMKKRRHRPGPGKATGERRRHYIPIIRTLLNGNGNGHR